MWLRLRPLPGDTAWTGSYYYLRRGGELQLRGRRTAAGAWLLRESAAAAGGSAAAPSTGSFTLKPAADGTLDGTWRDAKGRRSLPVTLRPYQAPADAPLLAARFSTRKELGEFAVPVITVPDAAVTKQLAAWFTLEYVTGMKRAELQQVRAEHQRGQSGGYGGPESYNVTYNAFGLLSFNWYDEIVGANVTGRVQHVTLDLRTGHGISLTDEIRPELMSRFIAVCDSSLQQQIRKFMAENDFSSEYMQEDRAGLRQQHVTQAKAEEGNLILLEDAVALTYYVEYDGMTHFMFKMYNGAFTPTLTIAELQPYLKPYSPLRRLARPVVSGR